MTTLALEFSSEERSVALLVGGEVRGTAVHAGTVRTPVFGLIEDVLNRAGCDRRAVERIVIGMGPGSYTGVRLAVSVAQGWQLATGVATVGIGSLENLARLAGPDPTWLAVDAQRQEFAVVEAAGGRLLGPPRLVPAEVVRRQVESGGAVAGPELRKRLGMGRDLAPTAAMAATLALEMGTPVAAETLVPVYLREAAFVKAPAPRAIPG